MQSRNAPTGWDAFRAFRQTPVPITGRRHGNHRHGRHSKQGVAEMRELRLLIRIMRCGLWNVQLPGPVRRIAPGWSAYRAARGQMGRLAD
jgi:hypothetical protein